MELATELIVLLFLLAALAGWVDAIAGGGGLITIPALMLAGLPPTTALATNKLQACAGSLAASLYFVRKRIVKPAELKLAIACTFIGSMLGGWLVLQVDTQFLTLLLPILLMAMGLYYGFSPKVRNEDAKGRLSLLAFSIGAAFLLGFYDGFFGPGTGSFMALAFILLLGYGLPKATAHAKVLNFVSNASALVFFMFFGEIHWLAGLSMMAGQFIGATFGARMVIKKGATIIKPIVVAICFLMSVSIMVQSFLNL